MVKKKKKKAQQQQRLRRRSMSQKDVQILALTTGVDAIRTALETHRVGIAVARRAADEMMKASPQLANQLKELLAEVAPEKARGRTAPAAGETRQYRVQVIGEGEPFIRLPLSLYDVEKGAVVTVRFEAKGATVQP